MLSRALSKSSPWPSIKSSPAMKKTKKKITQKVLRPITNLRKHESESELTHNASFRFGSPAPRALVSLQQLQLHLKTIEARRHHWGPPRRVLIGGIRQQQCSVAKQQNIIDVRICYQTAFGTLLPVSLVRCDVCINSICCFENDFYIRHMCLHSDRGN